MGIAASVIGALGSIGGGVAGGLLGGKGKGVTTRGALAPAGQPQKELIRGLRDLFGTSVDVTAGGAGQLATILPALYRELGYEPEIEDRTGDIAAAEAESADLQGQIDEIQAKIDKVKRRASGGKAATTGRPGTAVEPGTLSEQQKSRLSKLRTEKQTLRNKLNKIEGNLTNLRAEPVRITNIRPLTDEEMAAGGYGYAGSPLGELQDITVQQALAAARGEVEADPTLKREIDEAEGRLRERLRRQLGPGYEMSSAGIEALRNFERSKEETIAGYTRDLAGTLSERAFTGAASLSDLLNARLSQGVFLPNQVMGAGANLANLIQPGVNIGTLSQAERRLVHLTPAGGTAADTLQMAGIGGAIGQEAGAGLYSAATGIGSLFNRSSAVNTNEDTVAGTYLK